MLENNMDFVSVFQAKLAEYTGARYAVCTDSCTSAILASLYLNTLRGRISRGCSIVVPARTYMSVPMTLKLFGFQVRLDKNYSWQEAYHILTESGGNTGVVDAAVAFDEGMAFRHRTFTNDGDLVCVSFQQKKRLALGKGGAILTDSFSDYMELKRIVHDGRNPKLYHGDEVENKPEDIVLGFHSYMEPDKAAKGILLLNQPQLLPPYKVVTSADYPDLSKLGVFNGSE